MTKLRRATAALTMRGQRLGMNAWIELARELERRRALVRSMTPEARAMRRALNSWREVYEERLLMMKVTTARARAAHPLTLPAHLPPPMLSSPQREQQEPPCPSHCLLTHPPDLTPRLPLQAAMAITNKGLRTGLNAWVEAAAEWGYQRGLLFGIASPKGRAMRAALNSWCAMVDERAMMRRGAGAFADQGLRQAMNSWCAMFEERRKLLHATAGLCHRLEFQGFNTWKSFACERREAIDLMTRAAAALSQRGQRMAINAWAPKARERRPSAAEDDRHRLTDGPRDAQSDEQLAAARRAVGAPQALGDGAAQQGAQGALNTWRARAAELSAAAAQMGAALKALSPEGRAVRRALNSWRPLGAQRAMLRRAGMALSPKGRAMLRSLNKWGDVVRQRASDGEGDDCARAPARPPTAPSSLFPCSLHHSSSSRSPQPAPCRFTHPPDLTPRFPLQAATAMAKRGERLAFNGWVEAAAELSRRRGLLSSFMPKPRAMRRALNSWRARLEDRRHLLYATAALRHREVFIALNTWRSFASERRAALDLMVRAAAALSQRGQRMALNAWVEAAGERREAIALMKRAAAALAQRGLRSGLTAWVEAAADFAYRRGLLFGIASPKGRAMRRGLNSWRALAEERALMRRAGASLRHRGLRAATSAWRETARERRARARRMTGVLKSLSPKGRAMRRGLNSWRGMVAQRTLMRRAAAAVAQRGLRFGFNGWLDAARELGHQRFLLSSIVSPEGRALRRALNSWRARLDEHRHMLRATAALRNKEVFVALNTWRSYARERRVWSARIGGALKALSPEGRAMRRGLNSWRRMVEERAMMRKVTTARALPAPPSPRPSSSLFPCSLHHSSSSRSLPPLPSSRIPAPLSHDLTPHSPLQAAVAIANRGLRFGLNAWVERSAELSRRRALLRSVTPEARAMRKGFNSWCAMLDAYAHLLYATAALRHREVFVALNTWRSYARERREAIDLMTRAAAALSQRGQRMAINMWIEVAGERMARRALLRSMTPKARAMRRALNSWTALRTSRLLQRRALSALINRGMRRGWLRWRAVAADGRKRRAQISRALKTLTPEGRAMRRALNSWAVLLRQRLALRRGAMAIKHRELRMALNGWIEGADERRAALELMGRAGAAVAQRRERLAFNSWLEEAAELSRRRGIVRSMMPKARAMRRALNSWREMATNRRTALKLMRRAGAALRGRGIRMAMNGWTERRQRRRANLDSVRRSMAAWRHRGKRRGLNAWMGRVQDRLTALSLLRRSVAALMHRRLRRGFVTWARPFEMPASTLVYAPSPSAAPPHPFEAAATGVTDDSELALALRREEAARHQAEAQVEALAKKLHAAEVSAAEARAVAAGATPGGVTTRSAAAAATRSAAVATPSAAGGAWRRRGVGRRPHPFVFTRHPLICPSPHALFTPARAAAARRPPARRPRAHHPRPAAAARDVADARGEAPPQQARHGRGGARGGGAEGARPCGSAAGARREAGPVERVVGGVSGGNPD